MLSLGAAGVWAHHALGQARSHIRAESWPDSESVLGLGEVWLGGSAPSWPAIAPCSRRQTAFLGLCTLVALQMEAIRGPDAHRGRGASAYDGNHLAHGARMHVEKKHAGFPPSHVFKINYYKSGHP